MNRRMMLPIDPSAGHPCAFRAPPIRPTMLASLEHAQVSRIGFRPAPVKPLLRAKIDDPFVDPEYVAKAAELAADCLRAFEICGRLKSARA